MTSLTESAFDSADSREKSDDLQVGSLKMCVCLAHRLHERTFVTGFRIKQATRIRLSIRLRTDLSFSDNAQCLMDSDLGHVTKPLIWPHSLGVEIVSEARGPAGEELRICVGTEYIRSTP
jgi:hypothetical protein